MRVALAVIAALGAILLFLLASASANTALFAEHYPWLLAINGIAAVALVVLVGLQLRRLRRDFESGVFGSRLKSRLLLMLSLMAVLPGALVDLDQIRSGGQAGEGQQGGQTKGFQFHVPAHGNGFLSHSTGFGWRRCQCSRALSSSE